MEISKEDKERIEKSEIKLEEITPPIGDFIMTNAKGVMTPNGMVYHYTEVINLIRNLSQQLKEKEEQIKALTNSANSWEVTAKTTNHLMIKYSEEVDALKKEIDGLKTTINTEVAVNETLRKQIDNLLTEQK